ncbi:hypothetical protein J4G33_08030 [Actinotalea sp. BY-33]|uniref:DoxX family membrane protein n=1 Tax=Actinotalea soli TaxID=2819234 RepID=A0A939RSL7_9CELL|nr:hypothetical protein [Actinotalea soli]MBO1751747.1 hypothetical protein [Actinotalea soli]
MSLRLAHLPGRLAAGALILDSGLNKRNADAETAAGLHGMAAGTYPEVADMDPQEFVKNLSRAEIALGTALLLPFVPTSVVAVALGAFSGGLLRMYLKTPGLTKEGSVRPTSDGLAIAKDVWLAGIAGSLLLDVLTPRRRKH